VEPVSATSLTRQPEMAAKVTEYSTEHSEDTSPQMKQLWDWTCTQFGDSDKMSSPLQGVFMKFLAEQLRAKRGMFPHRPQLPAKQCSSRDRLLYGFQCSRLV
jgi:hypothetical protein